MKAIVNVNKNSNYARFNGLTFEVKEVLTKLVALDINGIITDFGHSEVFIVDFQNEIQKAYDKYNWDGKGSYHNLREYANKKGIVYKTQYSCPA